MNGKMKAVVVVALILGVVASAAYMAPALAYPNGTTDQTHDRKMNRIQDCECTCDCLCDQNQNQNQNQICIQHQEQAQNQQITGLNWQYCYEHRH